MKKTYLLLLLCCAAFYSCQKSKSNNAIYPSSYRVDGVHDFTMQRQSPTQITSAQLSLTVNYLGPIQENVTLSFEKLPAGIYLDQSTNPIVSGIPSFDTYLNIMDSSAAAGTYTVDLVCTGSATGRKTYPFKITVLPTPDCRSVAAGTYTNCNSACIGTTFSESVTLDPGQNSTKIYINNFLNTGAQISAYVQCGSSYLTIPDQQVGTISISGASGYFYSGYMYYSFYYNGTYCSVSMTR